MYSIAVEGEVILWLPTFAEMAMDGAISLGASSGYTASVFWKVKGGPHFRKEGET